MVGVGMTTVWALGCCSCYLLCMMNMAFLYHLLDKTASQVAQAKAAVRHEVTVVRSSLAQAEERLHKRLQEGPPDAIREVEDRLSQPSRERDRSTTTACRRC